uniref:Uncharacterized protein n=1 Tax=Anguilla anguilla TaxID=7936 RepID=A0A0E9RWA4_ANGAN
MVIVIDCVLLPMDYKWFCVVFYFLNNYLLYA